MLWSHPPAPFSFFSFNLFFYSLSCDSIPIPFFFFFFFLPISFLQWLVQLCSGWWWRRGFLFPPPLVAVMFHHRSAWHMFTSSRHLLPFCVCLSSLPPPLPPPPPLTRPTSTLVVIVIPAPRFHLDLFLRQPLCCTCCFLARLPPAFFSLFPPPFAFLSLRSALLRAPCLMCCSGETT